VATVYISEYARMGAVPNTAAQMPQEPPVATQTVAIGATSTRSAYFDPNTRFVRIHVDAVCSIAFGQNPVADATAGRFAANQTEFRGVPQGGAFCLAVISNS